MTIRDRKVTAPRAPRPRQAKRIRAGAWVHQPLDLLKMQPAVRARVLAALDDKESSELFHDWEFWGAP